jgi:ABC-type thiamine transport system substrate-binding protein
MFVAYVNTEINMTSTSKLILLAAFATALLAAPLSAQAAQQRSATHHAYVSQAGDATNVAENFQNKFKVSY